MGGGQSTISPDDPRIIKNNKNEKYDMVIIPVDQSRQAEAAFLFYVNNIHREGNMVQILHCQEWPRVDFTKGETPADSFDRAKREGKSMIEKYQKKLEDLNIPGSVHFEFGDPGHAVVNASERLKATHVVMGSRGFGILRRTILGSVSEYVIHHTKVPVTVVPRETQSWFF